MEEAAFSPGPRQPKRRGISLAKAIVLGCILAVLVLAVGGYFITLTLADRRLKAELRKLKASGAPLTLLEAAPRQVPPDENAAVLYEQAFIGLPWGPDIRKVADFACPEEAKGRQVSVQDIEEILPRYQVTLRLLEQATERPACRFPVDWDAGYNATLAHLVEMRAAARLLAANALVDADHGNGNGNGNGKQAIESIELILRMGDHLSPEPTLYSQLVRIHIQDIALTTLHRVVETSPVSVAEARRIYGTLRKIDNMRPFTRGLEGERCMGLWMFDAALQDRNEARELAEAGWGENPAIERRLLTSRLFGLWLPLLTQDKILYLRQCNRVVELSRKPYREVKHQYDALQREAQDAPKYAVVTRRLSPAFLLPTISRDKAIASVGVAQYGMALRAYQEAVGRYPESLAELRAKIDWPLPSDPFSGKDFIYRREGKGYLLYSIGPNMKDEGGKDRRSVTGPLPPGQEPPDDIAWRMSR